MNLHTFIKGPIHHLTRFYLTEVIFHWVPSQKFQTSTGFSDTCIIHVVVFVNTSVSMHKNTEPSKTFILSTTPIPVWRKRECTREWSCNAHLGFIHCDWSLLPSSPLSHPPSKLRSIPQLCRQPCPLKAASLTKPSVFSAEPFLQVICSQGLWVCRSVARHLIKPMAGYSEALGDETYYNMPTRYRLSTPSWAGCSDTV